MASSRMCTSPRALTSGSQRLRSLSKGQWSIHQDTFAVLKTGMMDAGLTYRRWIYYSAINSITPQIILNLGFEDNSWDISIRSLAFTVAMIITSTAVTWWATRFKDLSMCYFHTSYQSGCTSETY
jgi:hypothetical protein